MITALELPLTIEPARGTLLEPLRERIARIEPFILEHNARLALHGDGVGSRLADQIYWAVKNDVRFPFTYVLDSCVSELHRASCVDDGFDTWRSADLEAYIRDLRRMRSLLTDLRDAWRDLRAAERSALSAQRSASA